jgi:hypothetical protein
VNGQRPSSNYLTVDGASGNVFLSTSFGGGSFGTGQTGVAGSTYATSASGGTNGLLPVDAIEEFRMQTSTYSAEYGRSPGGQIQIRTRGGTNEFHGSLFEYFRNQVLDATDWFVKYRGLKQPPLRMNDFGGTLGGPILRNRLFFFAAHETLFLDNPGSISQSVPSALARQQVSQTFAPAVLSYPNGNGGTATTAKYPQYTDIYNVAYATQIIDHTTSARFDTNLPHNYQVFFRFNVAPSSSKLTQWASNAQQVNLQTYTAGVTKSLTPTLQNELTSNYTTNSAANTYVLLAVDGADPSGYNQYCSTLVTSAAAPFCQLSTLSGWTSQTQGNDVSATSNQINITDKLRWTIGRHSLSLGADFRRLSTKLAAFSKVQESIALTTGPTALAGNVLDTVSFTVSKGQQLTLPVDNFSLFVQDDWHATKRLTVNYGLRWEYNPPMSDGNGGPLAISGDVNNLATLAPAPLYTPLYKTTYANFAPRLGVAYQLRSAPGFATVVRAGAGLFNDTGQAATAASSINNTYPYTLSGSQTKVVYSQLNLQAMIQSAAAQKLPQAKLYVVDPNLKLPYTGEWNIAVEQQLFGNTVVSATYLGADGEKLGSTLTAFGYPNSNIAPALITTTGNLQLLTNRGRSNYQALQLQATIRSSSGIDGILGYTYSHNLDNGTSDFVGPTVSNQSYWGNADDDIRHALSVGLNVKPKGFTSNRLLALTTKGWVVNTFTRLQTASPLSVTTNTFNGNAINDYAPFADSVPGVPAYLRGSIGTNGKLIPGGIQLNPAAFTDPPRDANKQLLRQGNSGRNRLRLFGIHEFDLSAGRKFAITERMGFELKVEAFNIMNTPSFANPVTNINNANFGQAQNTYSGFMGGSGGLNSTFQIGGPRNLQLTANLKF